MDKLAPIIDLNDYRRQTGRMQPMLEVVPEFSYEAPEPKTRAEKLAELARMAILKGAISVKDHFAKFGMANLLEDTEENIYSIEGSHLPPDEPDDVS